VSSADFSIEAEPVLLRGVFFDVEYILWTGFRANSAGNTLRRLFGIFCLDHHLERTGVYTFATALAELFVDGKNTLGILGDCLFRTRFGALPALDAALHLNFAVFFYFDVDTGQVLLKITIVFVKSLSAGILAGQTVHASANVLNR
jgi:hypothetical protein